MFRVIAWFNSRAGHRRPRAGRCRNRDLQGCRRHIRGAARGLFGGDRGRHDHRRTQGRRPCYVGDSLARKRDYDGAISAFSKAHEADPENVFYINLRGMAYGNKGDDELRWRITIYA